ncbi:MAG TPA: ABC transporter permease subunit, partial [Candidatus Limnocylindria bacterium]|nr:ABC transporter permease subunit [Candidatus Limnocylindria bacterium]
MSGRIRASGRPSMAAIARRDLTVVLRSRAVVLPIIIVPIVLFVGLPLLLAAALQLGRDQLGELEALLVVMPLSIRDRLGDGPIVQQLLVYLIEYQFASLFLIVPLMVAAVIAADSFAGEKERKTLEALLYTPTTDAELYVAKLVAPFAAASGVGLAGYAAYLVSANVVAAIVAPDIGRLVALT